MSIMCDKWIIAACDPSLPNPMISPFQSSLVDKGVISHGVSSYGYDARLGERLQIFTNINNALVDPKRMPDDCRVDAKILTDEYGSHYAILPPNSFMLGHTKEYFRIPRDILVICLGKSTYARAGVIVNVTPLEPEWDGEVVIEISNTTPLPQKIYVNEGICQFIFLKAEEVCRMSYADRKGKYMGQTGITVGKVSDLK